MLGLSANKFEEEQSATSRNISAMFASAAARASSQSIKSSQLSASQTPVMRTDSPDSHPSERVILPASQSQSCIAEFDDSAAEVLFSQCPSRTEVVDRLSVGYSKSESLTSQSNSCQKNSTDKRRSLDFYFSSSQRTSPSSAKACSTTTYVQGIEEFSITGMEPGESGTKNDKEESKAGKKHGFFASKQKTWQFRHDPSHSPCRGDSSDGQLKEVEVNSSSHKVHPLHLSAAEEASEDDGVEIIDTENSNDCDTKDSGFFRQFLAKKKIDLIQPSSGALDPAFDHVSLQQSTAEVSPSTSACGSEMANQDSATECNPNSLENSTQHQGKLGEEDIMTCDKCGQTLAVWEMPEHSDFHFAMELQQAVDPLPAVSVTRQPACGAAAAASGVKRKVSSGRGGRGGKRGRPRKEMAAQSSNLLTFLTRE